MKLTKQGIPDLGSAPVNGRKRCQHLRGPLVRVGETLTGIDWDGSLCYEEDWAHRCVWCGKVMR